MYASSKSPMVVQRFIASISKAVGVERVCVERVCQSVCVEMVCVERVCQRAHYYL